MTDPKSPSEVFQALVEGVCERRWDELPSLYAAKTNVSHPFHPAGAPALRTREDVRDHFQLAGASAAPNFDRRPANLRVHETKDPEVIVAEFEYEGTADGEPFTIPCVFVLRVRDGEIVESRDYIDHIASARARGGLQDLIAMLAK